MADSNRYRLIRLHDQASAHIQKAIDCLYEQKVMYDKFNKTEGDFTVLIINNLIKVMNLLDEFRQTM